MWLSKVSSLGCPTRANKMRLLVLPAPAFIIALLVVIIFTSLGTRRFQRAVVGQDQYVFPHYCALEAARTQRLSGVVECLTLTSIHCLSKTACWRPRTFSAAAPTSRAAKIMTEYTNVRSKTPKGSGQRSPASFTGSRNGIRF